MRFIERPLNAHVKQQLIEQAIPDHLADIIARRIDTPEQAQRLMQASLAQLPNPITLPDMDKAMAILMAAISEQQRIVCVVDYDTDGICSGAILQEGLASLGANVSVMVTNRHEDGYGFSSGACQRILACDIRPDLVITADLGSSDGIYIEQLQQTMQQHAHPIQVIVTDHHHISSTHPPKTAEAFINPHRNDTAHTYNHPICGAMVAWNLIAALRAALRTQSDWGVLQQKALAFDAKALLDLVAVATVGDMVNLAHPINRIIVKYGLQRINQCQRPAWQLLKETLDAQAEITEETIGFQISPRINALSRMGDDGHTALSWLTTTSMTSCQQAWAVMCQNNEERKDEQALCESFALAQAEAQMRNNKFILIAYVPEASHGVVGLAAGRLAQRFGRPAIVFSDTDQGQLTGSARSIPGYDIRALIERVQADTDLINKYGGHAAAAGLSIPSQATLAPLSEAFEQHIRNDFNHQAPEAYLYHDGPLPSILSTQEGIQSLTSISPFGQGFTSPSFLLQASVIQQASMGKNGQHRRLTLSHSTNTIEAVWFNANEALTLIADSKTNYRFIVQLSINHFRGTSRPQALIQAVEAI